MVSKKTLRIQFICSKDQLADVFTKPLSSARFAFLRANLNVLPIPLRLQRRVKDISSPQLDMRSIDKSPTPISSQDKDKT
jgi:hypothetical protein